MNLQQDQRATLIQRMQMGMALSNFIELSRDDFLQKLREIEDSKLFKKLSSPGDERIIEIMPIKRYFPPCTGPPEEKSGGAPHKISPDRHIEPDINALDLESILEKHMSSTDRALLNGIRAMGVELFCYYFLDGEGTDSEIAQLLHTSVTEIKPLRQMFDRVIIADFLGLHDSSRLLNPDLQRTEIVAEICYIEDEPQVYFAYDRIRYKVDEKKLTSLFRSGKLTPDEIKEFKNIRDTITKINYRYNLLHEIVHQAVETQKSYIFSRKPEDMNLLEEKDMAHQLGVDPSWVCRLVNGKSSKRYLQSRNHLIPLRDLFVSKRQLNKQKGIHLIKQIYEDKIPGKSLQKSRLTDEEIKGRLEEDFHFSISRRAVNNWRREMKDRGHVSRETCRAEQLLREED